MKVIKRSYDTFRFFGILAFAYLLLNLVLPPNHVSQVQYHLSTLQYHVLLLVLIIPVLFIWFLAFYGYAKMKEYASLITDTAEGPSFGKMAYGLTWLAWGLPIPALISLFVTQIANAHPGFYSASVVISNYTNLIIPVIAFSLISTGSRRLLENAKLRISDKSTKILIFLFVVLGAIFCYLVFRNLGSANVDSNNNPYHLPNWLILMTLVIPYLYAWFVGLLAAYEMRLVSRKSKGVLYKQALDHLSRGAAVIVGSSIALQYITSALPPNGRLSLGYILLIIYLLLFVMGIGYGLLAYGANKLKKIEEV